MKGYGLLKNVCRMILPFVIMFGFYIIANGDLSPGGGFQGGVVLASCYLILFFLKDESVLHFSEIIRYEKWLFFVLILLALFYLIVWNTAFSSHAQIPLIQTLSLMLMNLVIGMKVTFGLWGILLIFTEEGQL